MSGIFFQILLFVASIVVAAVIPLLKQHWLKRMAMLSAVAGGAVSLVWAGYEYGLRQKEVIRKDLLAQIDQNKTEKADQDNRIKDELQTHKDENGKLKSLLEKSKSDRSKDSKLTPKPIPQKDEKDNLDSETSESHHNTKKTRPRVQTRRTNSIGYEDLYARKINTIPNSINKKHISKLHNSESPIVLEPTWVDSGASVQAINGQVIIRVYVISNSYGILLDNCNNTIASVYIDIPNEESIHACLNPGWRKIFSFKGNNYFLTLLEERSRNEKSPNETNVLNNGHSCKVSVVLAQ